MAEHHKPRDVEIVAYEDNFPFPYNSFVYAVRTNADNSAARNRPERQPDTHAIPLGPGTFTLRLPNPLSGYNDKIRVQNELAALDNACEASQSKYPGFVPRVLGWKGAEDG